MANLVPFPPAGSGFNVFGSPAESDDGDRKPAQRELITDAVMQAGATFWRTPEGDGCVTIQLDGRIERHRVRSGEFRKIATYMHGRKNLITRGVAEPRPGAASANAMREAIDALGCPSVPGGNRSGRCSRHS
jgi:hypothetical protein